MNDHEDDREEPDWEALAAEGERSEMMDRINAVARRIVNSPALSVSRQPPGTRLVVCPFGCEQEDNPSRDLPVEFTILDPVTLKVRVTDPTSFSASTEGILLGSGGNGNVTAPGQLKRLDWLIYEVDGKKYEPQVNTISRVELYRPGWSKPFLLWQDFDPVK